MVIVMVLMMLKLNVNVSNGEQKLECTRVMEVTFHLKMSNHTSLISITTRLIYEVRMFYFGSD
ncbi:hypothetical protein GLYMA_09G130550v4 [Glycine max]|nr:hypothetical protein GLYMA_09G130550v4 [Glycine max]KAH1042809.1 hypothetical protein GYH30_024904 [Glycine max]